MRQGKAPPEAVAAKPDFNIELGHSDAHLNRADFMAAAFLGDLVDFASGTGARRNGCKDGALSCATPLSEPERRFSCIRFTSQ
jgi:hypothetical protein